jgi:hypothetical protein
VDEEAAAKVAAGADAAVALAGVVAGEPDDTAAAADRVKLLHRTVVVQFGLRARPVQREILRYT